MSDHSRDQLAEAYEAAGCGELKLKGGELVGPCPVCGGEDRFHITRDGLIGCRGCNPSSANPAAFAAIMEALGLGREEDDGTYPESIEEPEPDEPCGCTLTQYALRTGLTEEFLRSEGVGLRDSKTFVPEYGEVDCVVVPFLNLEDAVTCTKNRVRVTGSDKYRYAAGSKAALYGESWLEVAQQKRKLILVEGESDAQTLWYHQLPAAGVPGVNSLKVLRGEHFEGIERVYVVAEQDRAGQKWPAQVAGRLQDLGVSAPVLVVHLDAKDVNDSYKLDPATFKRRFLVAVRYARGLRRSRIDARKFRTMREIMRTEFPPVRWIVPGILPEGLALLIAGPKRGKTFAATDLAASVARGTSVFGNWSVEQAEVLYIDLEQPISAKTKARARMVRADEEKSDQLTMIDEWPVIGSGCCEEIDIWLSEHPAAGLVVIDVLKHIKPGAVPRGVNVYDFEYEMMVKLKAVADRRHVAILVLHHDRKQAGANDPTEASSGTKAITGAANVVWWLKREFGCREGKLAITGRDVEEVELNARMSMGRWYVDLPPEPSNGDKGWS